VPCPPHPGAVADPPAHRSHCSSATGFVVIFSPVTLARPIQIAPWREATRHGNASKALQSHLRQHGCPLILPRRCSFIGSRRPQDRGVIEVPADYLQSDRQPVLREPCGDRGGGLPSHVELKGEGDPLEGRRLLALNQLWP